jgi:hypothetical protein
VTDTKGQPVPRDYLGDAVYAVDDGYSLILTTEDGIRATNTIHLEPEVRAALVRYMDRMKWVRSGEGG